MTSPTLSITPGHVSRNARDVIVTLTLNGAANWTPDGDGVPSSPIFTISGDPLARINRQIISTPNRANLWVNTGPIMSLIVVSDPLNSLSQSFSVDGTFEEEMLAKVENLLRDAVGFTSVQIDGQNVTVQALQDQRDYWLRRVNQQQGKRPRVSAINLGAPRLSRRGCPQ